MPKNGQKRSKLVWKWQKTVDFGQLWAEASQRLGWVSTRCTCQRWWSSFAIFCSMLPCSQMPFDPHGKVSTPAMWFRIQARVWEWWLGVQNSAVWPNTLDSFFSTCAHSLAFYLCQEASPATVGNWGACRWEISLGSVPFSSLSSKFYWILMAIFFCDVSAPDSDTGAWRFWGKDWKKLFTSLSP